MAKIYGDKVTTQTSPCRFVCIQATDSRGKYSIELTMSKEDGVKLNAELYGDNQKLIDHNKTSPKAKNPRPLYNPVYLYDVEAKESILDEEGNKVVDENLVKFSFKSTYAPKIQFKKGLDVTAKVGNGSLVKIVGCAFGGSTTDDKGKLIDFVQLQLKGVRVMELVSFSAQEVFDEDSEDEFEDAEYVVTEGEEAPQEEAPKKKSNSSY